MHENNNFDHKYLKSIININSDSKENVSNHKKKNLALQKVLNGNNRESILPSLVKKSIAIFGK